MVDETQSREQKKEIPQKNHRTRNIWLFTAALVICALLWLIYWLLYLQFHQYTDDAYANGNLINVNAAIPGSVIAFFADDTDLVEEGQLLVQLDSTLYQMQYEQELAALAATVLNVRQLYDTVEVNRANQESKKIAFQRAQYDFNNRAHLVDSQAISNEDFVHARDDFKTAESNLRQAEAQFFASLDAAGNTDSEHHPLIEEQKAKVRAAYYNLHHCSVYASYTGYIAQRTVDVGQWVTPTTNMMAIIPKDYVWVDANYKETQLTYMRIGQPATVWFDIYGSQEFQGKVLGIASGSGSVFSLIPPQNATGNWIKIVQRLPVRIGIDPKDLQHFPLRLGISAEVDVNITDQNLPMLAQTPSLKPISTTGVFNINLEKVNQIIQEIIEKNMAKK